MNNSSSMKGLVLKRKRMLKNFGLNLGSFLLSRVFVSRVVGLRKLKISEIDRIWLEVELLLENVVMMLFVNRISMIFVNVISSVMLKLCFWNS